MLTVSVNELPAWIELAARSKNNVLVVGNPGVGKSQVIGGMASDDCKVTMMTGSSTIEEYVNGIPTPDEKDGIRVLKYIAPEWLADMIMWSKKREVDGKPKGRQVLFLDEFNTADPQVLKTFLTILTERKIPTLNVELPEETVIVAAMNPQEQNDGEPLIRPMASRFMTLKIEATLDTYRAFLLGKDGSISGKLPVSNDEAKPIDDKIKATFLSNITPKEWQRYKDSDYHEICPRSMSNFYRALEWVKDAESLCPNISQAFLGLRMSYPQTVTNKTDIGQGKKLKIAYLNREQLEKLSDTELKAYYNDITRPNVTGQEAIRSRAMCNNVMRERGIKL